MKELEITDKFGTGKVLLCEKHYKQYLPQISIASEHRVAIIIRNSSKRGCVQCLYKKAGASPWCGTMFKIWYGYNKHEKARLKDETD